MISHHLVLLGLHRGHHPPTMRSDIHQAYMHIRAIAASTAYHRAGRSQEVADLLSDFGIDTSFASPQHHIRLLASWTAAVDLILPARRFACSACCFCEHASLQVSVHQSVTKAWQDPRQRSAVICTRACWTCQRIACGWCCGSCARGMCARWQLCAQGWLRLPRRCDLKAKMHP
jgi:hypothetical protein